MIIKAGTPCYVTDFRKVDKYVPIFTDSGKTYFSIDQEVEVTNYKCKNKNFIAVLAKANSIENLVSHDEVKTIVWVNKNNI